PVLLTRRIFAESPEALVSTSLPIRLGASTSTIPNSWLLPDKPVYATGLPPETWPIIPDILQVDTSSHEAAGICATCVVAGACKSYMAPLLNPKVAGKLPI